MEEMVLSMDKMPSLRGTLYEDVARNAQGFYSLPVQVAVCLPSQCSPHEVSVLANKLLHPLFLSLQLGPSCDVDDSSSRSSFLQSLNAHQLFALVAISLMLAVVLLSSLMHLHFSSASAPISAPDVVKRETGVAQWLLCFSLARSSRKLFAAEQEADTKLHFVHGMRVMTMIWIIVCHTYTYGTQFLTEIGCECCCCSCFFKINLCVGRRQDPGGHSTEERRGDDAAGVERLARCRNLLLPQVRSVLPACLPLFLLTPQRVLRRYSGVIVTCIVHSVQSRGHGELDFWKYVSLRWLRFTPGLFGVVMLHFLWPLLGSGPMWKERTEALMKPCYSSWWQNFLYVNNWVSHHQDIVRTLCTTVDRADAEYFG